MTGLLDRRTALVWLVALIVLAAAGCTGIGGSPTPTPGPTILPGPTGGGTLTEGELRLQLIDTLGQPWFCDPDAYPVGRDEQQSAIERYAEIKAGGELFAAVAEQLGIDPAAEHSDADKLAIWRLWKEAASIPLAPIGDGRFRFDHLARPVDGATEGIRTAGTIDARGSITIEQQAAAGEPVCPICLDRTSTIDTPNGPIAVDRLRLGDAVWTLDREGRRVAGTVVALGSTPAPTGHHVIRLTLADGRTATASPGHPTADGRTIGELEVGDTLRGSRIVSLASVAYQGGETFDLAVSGETGIYFAGGIPLRSTLE